MAATPPRAERAYNLEILLASFAVLLLEISYTRVISFKLFYYYTYFVIGLALLGIGTGGTLVAISERLRRASTNAVVTWSLLLGAISVGVGYFVVAWLTIDTFAIWRYNLESLGQFARLLVLCLTLFASFVAVGVLLATLFGRRSEQIGRLYFADLLGAALACAIVVWLLGTIGPPATILASGLVLAATGFRCALRGTEAGSRIRSPAVVLGAILVVALAVGVIAPSVLPDPRGDASKIALPEGSTMLSSWSPLFRVDVVNFNHGSRTLIHDGLFGSAIYRWNRDPSTLTRYESDLRSLPFAVQPAPPRHSLIIGAAGGQEVLASLFFGAKQIDAIELNPVTYDLVTNRFAHYDGQLAKYPGVNYVKGDGRSFLARSDDRYDLVWFPAPDSYSAANAASAGAFVLSESYLYTRDTIVDSFDHLRPHGILAYQYGELDYEKRANRTLRYVGTARDALAELGVRDPKAHILVGTTDAGVSSTVSTVLVKRTTFTTSEIESFVTKLARLPGGTLRYAPGHHVPGSVVSDLVTTPNSRLDAWYDDYPYDVRPITDDAPFFWHFTSFNNAIAHFTDPIERGDPDSGTGERVLLLLLLIAIVFAGVFLLLPFVKIRSVWTALPSKPRSALYFAALGLGFMFFEVTLIQRLVLFLGYPTYSLTVTLMSILIFTGLGALLSGRCASRPRVVIPSLLGALALLTAFYEWGLPEVTQAMLGAPLGVRVVVTFVVLAPLGLCLGMFMPLGLGAVARLTPFGPQYVAWGWAVNGFASVIGVVLSTILAMTFGFQVVLGLALVLYCVAIAALRGLVRANPVEIPSG